MFRPAAVGVAVSPETAAPAVAAAATVLAALIVAGADELELVKVPPETLASHATEPAAMATVTEPPRVIVPVPVVEMSP